MTSTIVKPEEKDEVVIEEEGGVFQRTIKQISSPTEQKRKREEDTPIESSRKYVHNSDGDRSSTTRMELASLSVPFWKHLNDKHISFTLQTREVGSFSLINHADKKECFEDKRYLRVYKYPLETLNVSFDLKVGESTFVAQGKSENIDAMLWWALRHKEDIFKNNQFNFDLLSWRGVLRLIMFSIYEKHSDWLLAVIKFKNAYFLCEYVTDSQLKDEQTMTAEHRSFCYYGHKFEEYVTKNDAKDEPTSASKQFAGVFRSTIGSYRLLYGAEMDCVVEKSSSITEHIELKVCAGKSLTDLPFQYNRKFAKWWIQCFLVGIEQMVVGLRDNNGMVNKLTPLNISDMERETRTWTRQSFLNFFSLFANFLKEHVTKEYSPDYQDVALFRYVPSVQKITVTKSSSPKYHFLPDWFVNGFT